MRGIVDIYALQNPLTGKIFYVGATTLPLQERLQRHLGLRSVPTVRALKYKGISPIIGSLELCEYDEGDIKERYWIDELRKRGYELDNRRSPIKSMKKRKKGSGLKEEFLFLIRNNADVYCSVCKALQIKPYNMPKFINSNHQIFLQYGCLLAISDYTGLDVDLLIEKYEDKDRLKKNKLTA